MAEFNSGSTLLIQKLRKHGISLSDSPYKKTVELSFKIDFETYNRLLRVSKLLDVRLRKLIRCLVYSKLKELEEAVGNE